MSKLILALSQALRLLTMPAEEGALDRHRSMIVYGSFYRTLLTLALPMVVFEAVNVSYNLVDAYWLGFWGGATFAVPRLARPTYMLFEAVFMGLGAANLAMMSQYIGARRYEEAARTFSRFLTANLVLGILLTLVYAEVNDFLVRHVVRAPPELVGPTLAYANVIALDIFIYGFDNAFTNAFQSIGNTRMPAAAGIASASLNFVLDPVLIVGLWGVPGMGPAGAAMATVISRLTKVLVLSYSFTREFPEVGVRLTKSFSRLWLEKVVTVGGPMYLRQALNSVGVMFQHSIVNYFGVVATQSYTIGFLFMDVAEAVVRGSTTPIAVMVGQNLGARNLRRAREIGVRSYATLGSITAAVTSVLFLIRERLVTVFTSDPAVIGESMRFLTVFLPTLPFLTILFVGVAVGRGSGSTVVPLAITLARMWGMRITLAYLLSITLGMGTGGLWLAISLSNLVAGIASAIWITVGRWCRPIV